MADPDLQIRRGGHPSPEKGGGVGLKKNFSALQASVWSKNKGGPGPLGPSLGSDTAKFKYGPRHGFGSHLELTSRQPHEKLQCLCQNLMSNNFRNTVVLKRIMNFKVKLHS